MPGTPPLRSPILPSLFSKPWSRCGLALAAALAVTVGCDGGNGGTGTSALPTVRFSVASQTVAEGAGTATVTAQLSSSSSDDVTVPFTVSGTASDPDDYTIDPSPLTIPAGSTSGTITVTLVADGVAEPDETVIVTMGTPTNATSGATKVHTLTIAMQLPSVSFTAAAQTVNEGEAATLTAQLSQPSTQDVTVPFTMSGSATNPADYTISASPLTIPAGSTTGTITVTVVADAVAEPNETVIVTLGTPTNATLGATSVHTVTVTGQVPTVSFTAATQTVNEGVVATITAQLSSVSSQAVTLPFTVGGTATNPADFTISASPLTIAAGSATGTITVTVVADAVAEPNETVIVTMGAPTNATVGATTVHTLTIAAQTPTVSFTSATQTVAEGGGPATITAQLSQASTQAVTVPFTVSGTATDPADYSISASPLTIAAGSTTGTITVTPVADGVVEPNETVIVTLGTPTNATLGATTVHTLTIADQVPTVSFTTASQTVNEGVAATITAQLSSLSSQAVTVPFTVSGSATSPADYTITASPLTITAGNMTGTITVTVVADGVAEPNETVIVTMGTPTNAIAGATTVHTLTIAAQVPTVTFTAAAQSVAEGAVATITAQLSQTSTQVVTVPFTVSGTATNPADYTITASPLTIATGNTSATITVTVAADGVAEPDETVIVTMGAPTNATQGATTVHTLTITGQGGSGNVTLDFSACPIPDRPLWVAGQNGSAAWVAVTGVNNVYQFNVTSGRGGYAFVLSSNGSTNTLVQFYTQAEITATPFVFCGPGQAGKTITGTAAGIGAADQALISLGGEQAPVVTPATLNFTITGVPSGPQDLVGYRRALIGGLTGQKAIIRRDQNIADGGSVGTVDFGGSEAFVPHNATITVAGLAGGENVVNHSMDYRVGAGCEDAALYPFGDAGTTFTASGIPDSMQRASDFHGIAIQAQTPSTGAFRQIVEYFHTMADRTVTLSAAMPTPTLTALTAPYRRLQAVYTLPTDFNFVTQFTYSAGARSVTMIATLGYLGGQATTLAFADYSGLSGWDNSWVPGTNDQVSWTTTATGGSLVSLCTENANRKLALAMGTF